jgi:hypothetical protein
MPLLRSTSVNPRSKRSLRKRTSSRTDLLFPERRSPLLYLVSPRVCVKLVTTPLSSRSVLLDSWLKRRPNGKLPMPRIELHSRLPRLVEMEMSRWTMELLPPHQPRLPGLSVHSGLITPNVQAMSTVHPEPIDNLSVWLQGNRISKPTNSEISLSENQTGWQRLPSQIDMYPLRDRNGCWLERERVERPTEDSLVFFLCFLVYLVFLFTLRRVWLCMYTLRSAYSAQDRTTSSSDMSTSAEDKIGPISSTHSMHAIPHLTDRRCATFRPPYLNALKPD